MGLDVWTLATAQKSADAGNPLATHALSALRVTALATVGMMLVR